MTPEEIKRANLLLREKDDLEKAIKAGNFVRAVQTTEDWHKGSAIADSRKAMKAATWMAGKVAETILREMAIATLEDINQQLEALGVAQLVQETQNGAK